MQDVLDIIKNIESIYDSNTSFQVLKDFERVIDELDIYVYKNWKEGELCEGPKIDRHWVTCCFMWPQDEMPDGREDQPQPEQTATKTAQLARLLLTRPTEPKDP